MTGLSPGWRKLKRRAEANTRTRLGRTPTKRLAILDEYLRLPRGDRSRWLKRMGLTPQTPVWWTHMYYGKGLRDLRTQLGLNRQ